METWADRYRRRETPWQLPAAHPELLRRIADLGTPGTAVVPGARRGHDAAALASAGWQVTALDVVPEVANPLSAAVGEHGTAVIADALTYQPLQPFDLLFDHTFFCALPLDDRDAFGGWAKRTVRPGGTVVSVVYPVAPPLPDGPPHGMSAAELASVLGPDFELELDEPALDAGRSSWPTRFCVFRRRPDGAAGGNVAQQQPANSGGD